MSYNRSERMKTLWRDPEYRAKQWVARQAHNLEVAGVPVRYGTGLVAALGTSPAPATNYSETPGARKGNDEADREHYHVLSAGCLHPVHFFSGQRVSCKVSGGTSHG